MERYGRLSRVANHAPPPPACYILCILTTDLGYSASESYGLSYKARGLCKTLENVDIFDDDQVNCSTWGLGSMLCFFQI